MYSLRLRVRVVFLCFQGKYSIGILLFTESSFACPRSLAMLGHTVAGSDALSVGCQYLVCPSYK